MSLHNLCSWVITLAFRVCIAKVYLVGTCHKDLERISSILSAELIFNIFYIYYCYRFQTSWCHGCCSLLKHILSISELVFVIPKDRSHDWWQILGYQDQQFKTFKKAPQNSHMTMDNKMDIMGKTFRPSTWDFGAYWIGKQWWWGACGTTRFNP